VKIFITRILGWVSMAIWFGGIGLWFQYDWTRPTTPDQQTGRIYALNTHSHVVYLTRAESNWLNGVLATGFISGFIAIALGLSTQLSK